MDAIAERSRSAGAENHTLGASEAIRSPGFPDPPKVDLATLDQMLRFCLDQKADDLLLMVGERWAVLWSDKVVFCGERKLYLQELDQLVQSMTGNPNAGLDLMRANNIDFTYTMKLERGRVTRFRCNATACLGPNGQQGMEIVIRPTGKVPPTMTDLGVPGYIQRAACPKSGIVMICGPTGSGKTTLLDSIMRELATSAEGKHILTYYAPIENDLNIIPNRTGLISQCEIGRPGYGAHLPSFAHAVRNSLRRHPQVIAFGEARDRETIEGAVLLSMTGHATYTTTHTSNVHMAIPRMADMFDGADRVRITNALIDNTRLIVHQRLVRRPGGIGRAPVRSALELTQDIRAELLRTHVDQLPAAIYEATNAHGIGLLDDAIRQFEAGNICEEELVGLKAELESEVR